MTRTSSVRDTRPSDAFFWLSPVQLSWNKGFREADLREIARILTAHESELIEAWHETE
ncbi:MAG: DUF4160 domain-containing protein [Chloroflexi bacterium]|nr:DUF4160 domain-containing protein [Chloroflexota bacterium]